MLVRRARLFLVATFTCGGFDEFVADEKPQQFPVDVDITAGAGVVASDADLLPRHTRCRWNTPGG